MRFRVSLLISAVLLCLVCQSTFCHAADGWVQSAWYPEWWDDYENQASLFYSGTSLYIDINPLPDGTGFLFSTYDAILRYTAATRSYDTLATHLRHYNGVFTKDCSHALFEIRDASLFRAYVVYTVATMTPRCTLTAKTHTGTFRCLQFFDEDRYIAALAEDNGNYSIIQFDAISGREIGRFSIIERMHNPQMLSFSEEGDVCALLDSPSQTTAVVQVWNTITGKHTSYPLIQPDIRAFASVYPLSVSGGLCAYANTDRIPVLLNLATGQHTVLSDIGPVDYLQIRDRGTRLVCMGHDGTLRLYDLPTQQLLRSYTLPRHDIRHVELPPDGSCLAVLYRYSCDNQDPIARNKYSLLAFYDSTGTLTHTQPPAATHVSWITSLALSPNGAVVASAGTDNRTLLFDAATGSRTAEMQGTGALAFTHDGRLLLRASHSAVDIIDPAAQTVVQRTHHSQDTVHALVRSHNGALFAARHTTALTLFRFPSMQQWSVTAPAGLAFTDVAFTPGSDSVVALLHTIPRGWHDSLTIGVWNTEGALLSLVTYRNPGGVIGTPCLSPRGDLLAFATGNSCHVVSRSGTLVRTISLGGESQMFTFSSTGSYIFTSSIVYAGTYGSIYLKRYIRRHWLEGGRVDDIAAEFRAISPRTAIGLLTSTPREDALLCTSVQGCQMGSLRYIPLHPPHSIALSATAVVFDTVYTGTTAERTFSVSFTADHPVVVHKVALDTSAQDNFVTAQYSGSLPDTLQPGEQRTVLLTCAPAVDTRYFANGQLGSLSIDYSDPIARTAVLSVLGSTAGPQFVANVDTLDFGEVLIGRERELTIGISSGNPAHLLIAQLGSLPDSLRHEFIIRTEPPLPVTLRNGDSLTLRVYYHPYTARAVQTALPLCIGERFDCNWRQIPMRGTGVRPVDVAEQPEQDATLRILPHPVAEEAQVHVALRTPGPVRIDLLTATGAHAAAVFSGDLPAGTHAIPLATGNLPAGLYLCRIITTTGTGLQRILLAP